MLERRQLFDGLPALFFGQPNLVEALKIQPKLRRRPEKVSQAQRRVSGNRTLTVQNRRDAIRRNLQPTGELRGAHVEGPKLLGQVLSRMNSPRCHVVVLTDNRQSRRLSGQAIRPATQSRCATDHSRGCSTAPCDRRSALRTGCQAMPPGPEGRGRLRPDRMIDVQLPVTTSHLPEWELQKRLMIAQVVRYRPISITMSTAPLSLKVRRHPRRCSDQRDVCERAAM